MGWERTGLSSSTAVSYIVRSSIASPASSNPLPTLAQLSSSLAPQGGPALTLTLTGHKLPSSPLPLLEQHCADSDLWEQHAIGRAGPVPIGLSNRSPLRDDQSVAYSAHEAAEGVEAVDPTAVWGNAPGPLAPTAEVSV